MFDLRYHVASLAAVFLALVIGILVGVGISDRGLVDSANRSLLKQRVAQLQADLDAASKTSALSQREQRAAQVYMNESYPVLVRNRLRGKRIAVVFAGSVKHDGGVRSTIERALTDSGAIEVRLRALKLPLDVPALEAKLKASPAGIGYTGRSKLQTLGQALGDELVSGGDTPLWDTLTDTLVEERTGDDRNPVDGVIVARTVPPQHGVTSKFLLGLYQGLDSAGVPAVGVEETNSATSAIDAFQAGGLSSVDDVDKPVGKLGLVLLLAGAPPGQYGLKASADQSLPPFVPVAPPGG
jgi:Copper transport outer membrane protein, MctB